MMTEYNAIEIGEEAGMQWQAVDSSQISEIGYESGAEYPLGIKFPPNKKQKAAGDPGSEYHYANVTPELHAEFLAAKTNPDYDNSIGVFFGKRIKNNVLYPFIKVEAGNPPQPPSSPNGGGKSHSKTADGVDAEPTGTALALIDTMADDLLFTPGAVTDAQLEAGRSWYLTEAKKHDISTEAKRTELKRFARPLQKLRTGIENRAKELTGATKRKIAAIDEEKRRLVRIVGGIEDEVLAPLTQWEQEEETRKQRLSGIVAELGRKAEWTSRYDNAELEAIITELESFDLSTMQEFKVGAESAIAASLRVLKPELARRKEAEAQAAELAELRRKQAERDEADRVAEQKRKDDERIAAAAAELAAKQVAQALEAERKRVAEPAGPTNSRYETARDYGESHEASVHLLNEPDVPTMPDWMEPTGEPLGSLAFDIDSEPEDSPELVQATLPVRRPTCYAPAKTIQPRIHAEIAEALMGCALTLDEAESVVRAIVEGHIPHVTITY